MNQFLQRAAILNSIRAIAETDASKSINKTGLMPTNIPLVLVLTFVSYICTETFVVWTCKYFCKTHMKMFRRNTVKVAFNAITSSILNCVLTDVVQVTEFNDLIYLKKNHTPDCLMRLSLLVEISLIQVFFYIKFC